MFVVRRIFRWSFTLGGLFFLRMGLTLYAAQHEPYAPAATLFDAFLPILCLAGTFVFILAWWSTRKANGRAPKPWALLASGINVVYGTILLGLRLQHSQPVSIYGQLPGIIALGIAGILLFRPRTAPSKKPSAEKSKPKRMAGDRTSFLGDEIILSVSLIAQFIAGRLWYSYAHAHNIPLFHEAYYYALAIAAGLFASTLHECGHALTGMLLHMKLISFETGPFQWLRDNGQWNFKFTPVKFVSLGGAAGILPASPTAPPWHEAVAIAAGPATSLIIGLFGLHIALNSQPRFWQFFALTASAGFIASIINMLPLRLGNGRYSDGARLLQLATSSPLAEYKKVAQLIHSIKVTQLRPRDVDPDMVRHAIHATSIPELALEIWLFLTAIHVDRGSRSQARACFLASELFITQNRLEVPANLLSDMVINAARFRRHPSATQIWWERLQKARTIPETFNDQLAIIAELWMQDVLDDAREACLKARIEARSLTACGATDVQRETCESLLKEIEHAIALAETADSHASSTESACPGELAFSSLSSRLQQTAKSAGAADIAASGPPAAASTEAQPVAERRRWPRTSTTGRNMWPRPNVS